MKQPNLQSRELPAKSNSRLGGGEVEIPQCVVQNWGRDWLKKAQRQKAHTATGMASGHQHHSTALFKLCSHAGKQLISPRIADVATTREGQGLKSRLNPCHRKIFIWTAIEFQFRSPLPFAKYLRLFTQQPRYPIHILLSCSPPSRPPRNPSLSHR